MKKKTLEAMLASPPERDELVVQLFHRDGAQWGEIYREGGAYRIQVFAPAENPVLEFDADEVLVVLSKALDTLKKRLEQS